MSDTRSAPRAAERVGSGPGRLVGAWRGLPHERRLAAFAAAGLFVTLFLPWYQETVLVADGAKTPVDASASVTGWGAFSFVEAAVLLVAAGVLVLLFQRAEGKAFHLPGGDGWVITAAGLWTCVLVVWRIFDKQRTAIKGPGADISGIEWGIFVALAVAAFLAYSGSRIRAAHQPEPPLPGEAARPPGEALERARQRRRATTPRPVAANPPRAQGADAPGADEPAAPRRRRRAEPQPAPQPAAAAARTTEDAPIAAEWTPPSTDWLSAAGGRPPRDSAAGKGDEASADDHDDDARTQRIARDDHDDDARTQQIETARLGPSTQAARRTRRPDDQLTIPLEPED